MNKKSKEEEPVQARGHVPQRCSQPLKCAAAALGVKVCRGQHHDEQGSLSIQVSRAVYPSQLMKHAAGLRAESEQHGPAPGVQGPLPAHSYWSETARNRVLRK